VYLNQVKIKAAQLEASSPTRGQHIWSTAALVSHLQVKTKIQAAQLEASSLKRSS
jgi:hypothetical protein